MPAIAVGSWGHSGSARNTCTSTRTARIAAITRRLGALRETAPGTALVLALTAAPDLDGWAIVKRLLTDLAPLEDRLWLVIDVAAACVTCPSLNIWAASLPESHSRGTAQVGIAGAARPSWLFGPMPVTGPGSRSRPANHLDPVTTAHPPGHKTAKAIWASSTDAESR